MTMVAWTAQHDPETGYPVGTHDQCSKEHDGSKVQNLIM